MLIGAAESWPGFSSQAPSLVQNVSLICHCPLYHWEFYTSMHREEIEKQNHLVKGFKAGRALIRSWPGCSRTRRKAQVNYSVPEPGDL